MEGAGGLWGRARQEASLVKVAVTLTETRLRPLITLPLSLISALHPPLPSPNDLFPSAFLSLLYSNVLLLPSVFPTLLSLFPSPYINPSEGGNQPGPRQEKYTPHPPNKDLWKGNLANPSEWVCFCVGRWRHLHPGRSPTLRALSALLTTGRAGDWNCNLLCWDSAKIDQGLVLHVH